MEDGARRLPTSQGCRGQRFHQFKIYPNDKNDEISISSGSIGHSKEDKVEVCDVLEEIVSEASNANPWEEHDRNGWRTFDFIGFSNSWTQNTSYIATSIEMTLEYFRSLHKGTELTTEGKNK